MTKPAIEAVVSQLHSLSDAELTEASSFVTSLLSQAEAVRAAGVRLSAPASHTRAAAPSPLHYLEEELHHQLSLDSPLFRFLETGSLDGMWYWDLENPSEEWMSPRFKEVLGYLPEEVPHKSWWWQQQVFPEDLTALTADLRQHCADPRHPYDQVARYRHKDGSTVWIRCRGVAIRDAAGKPIRMLGTHTDVTAAKAAEERFRALHEASPSMYFRAGIESGLITDCSFTLAQSTGFTRTRLLTFSAYDLFETAGGGSLAGLLQHLREDTSVSDIELLLKTQEGKPLTVLLSVQISREDSNSSWEFRGWCRDITFLKRIPNLQVVFDALSEGVVISGTDGRIAGCNVAVETMLGYQRGELIGMPVDVLVPGRLQQPSVCQLIAGNDTISRRKNGSEFPTRISLSDLPTDEGVLSLAVISDISESYRAQQALQQSERRFRQLCESLPQLVWTRRPDGMLDYLSRQWVAYTGIGEQQQLGLSSFEPIHPDDCQKVTQAWAHAVSTAADFQAEFRIRASNGSYHWFDTRARPLRDERGEVVRWVGSSTDIQDSRGMAEALRCEIERLTKIAEASPAALLSCRLSADGLSSFPYISPTISAIYGVSAEQIKADPAIVFQLTDHGDRQRVRDAVLQSARTLSNLHCEWRVNLPDRGEIWVEGHTSPVREADGSTTWHGVVLEITERKRLETLRVMREEQLERLTEFAPVAIAMFDRDMRYLAASRRFKLDYGLGDQDLTGVCHYDVFPDISADSRAADQRCLAGYPESREQDLHRRADGVEHWRRMEKHPWHDAAGAIGGMLLYSENITERKRIQLALEESEERMRLALSAGSIGTWDHNVLTGKFVADANFRRAFGFHPADEVTSQQMLQCMHPDDRDRVLEAHDRPFLLRSEPRFTFEHRVVGARDGIVRDVFCQGRVTMDMVEGKQQAVRSIGIVQDITVRKHSEDKLRRVNQELRQLAYAAAHDLQEPLRNVALCLDWLRASQSPLLDPASAQMLDESATSAQRVQAMVQDLLAFTHLDDEEGEEIAFVDANEILKRALLNLSGRIAESNAQITAGPLPCIRVRGTHLLQLFQNLIGNSIKYRSPESAPHIQLSATRLPGGWRFLVADNGIGFEPIYAERIFKLFKRLHGRDAYEGTGMGLAICAKIVALYNGRIWAESEPGKGANFYFALPAGGETQPQSPPVGESQ